MGRMRRVLAAVLAGSGIAQEHDGCPLGKFLVGKSVGGQMEHFIARQIFVLERRLSRGIAHQDDAARAKNIRRHAHFGLCARQRK